MANIKISQLPEVSTLLSTDVLPSVATATTSKITLKNLGNAIPGVTSSISASFAHTASYVKNAQTASYVLNAVSSSFASTASYVKNAQTASYILQAVSSSFALTASLALTASYVDGDVFTSINPALTASHALSASYLIGGDTTFPYTGSAKITGSLGVTGSISTTGGVYLSNGIYIKDSVAASNNYIYLDANDSLNLVGYGAGVKVVSGGGTLIATISSGTNNFVLSGSAIISKSLSVLGELNATSSQAFTASYVNGNSFTTDNKALSASNALTASYVDGNSFTTDNKALSASNALTASYVPNAASFPFDGQAVISQSLQITGSFGVTGSAHILGSLRNGGISLTATGFGSHAEGIGTSATANYSHAEGEYTNARAEASHTEGSSTEIKFGATAAHAEGYATLVQSSGLYAHAEGENTFVNARAAHVEGLHTSASGDYQHVQGRYNINSTAQSAFIIGNGINGSNRSNLVFASGSGFEVSGSLLVTGSFKVAAGFAVLQQVSESLNFADDTAAAAGGVPLGGIYRSGNVIAIRIV